MPTKQRPTFLKSEISAISILAAVLFFRMFGVFVILPIFSLLALDLKHATPALVGLSFGAYGLTQAALQVPFGFWSDRWARKPVIIIGLVVFLLGCVVSALATDIYIMLIGRLLQGAGAVSSVLIALLGDQVRSAVQTRAMAFMGISVGLAFAIAFFSSSFLAHWLGLSGIFWLLVVSGILVIFILSIFKLPVKAKRAASAQPLTEFWRLLKTKKLNLTLFSNFTISFGLSLFMFNLPLSLVALEVVQVDFWHYYLPLLLVGLFVMFPAAAVAEKYRKFKEVMSVGAVCLILAAIVGLLGVLQAAGDASMRATAIIAAIYIFFIGFNVFEPILPSLTIKLSGRDNRGAASGLLNFFQFSGNFLGALVAGIFYYNFQTLPFLMLVFLGSFMLYLILKNKTLVTEVIA